MGDTNKNKKDPKNRYVNQVTTYLDEYQFQVLTALTIKMQSSAAKVLRRALMEMAARRLN